MPLYEYMCVHCGASFEYLVRSSSSKEEVVCPKCASAEVNKKLSTFGVKGGSVGGGASAPAGANCAPGGG
jgi:putative FmdB family regulatory protein